MKTIVILIDQFYTHGGIEKLVAIKANYWTERFGYKVIIVSTEQKNNPQIYKLSEKVEFIDIDINYNRSISFFHPKNFKKLYSNIKELKKIFNTRKPDFILVASHIPMTYILPFVEKNAKIIKEFHYSKFSRVKTRKEQLFSSIEKKYDHLVVLSKEEETFYNSTNVDVIPNPVLNIPEVITDINKKENVAGAILRFAPVKQLEKMIDIWDLFYTQNKDWKLYIYGTGDENYFEKIKNIVVSKDLGETIIFKGQTDDVIKAFSEIKVLLMTSSNECFPMVILEANACGVPVVSFDSPTGPRNIIRHNVDGVIVPLNDVNIFVEEFNKLIRDSERLKQMSEQSVENAKQYMLDKVMNRWKKEIFEKND